MKEIQTIEVHGQRVLTTRQIAEAYETDPDRIKLNYRYNKARFTVGKHLIKIEGDELKDFKTRYQFDTLFKHTKCIYLWTEKGALLHAKSLNTDKAWEVYDYLVDFYFRVQEKTILPVKAEPISPPVLAMIDIPNNKDLQIMIRRLKKKILALEIAVDGINHEMNESKLKDYQDILADFARTVFNSACDIAFWKPAG